MRTRPTASPARPARGRPRSAQAAADVLKAAHALVREGGYRAATIEAIAARSGVAKTTIYRRWRNRPTLVVDLLLRVSAELAPPPAGDDPIRALRGELRRVAEASDALPGRLLVSLLGESQHDPEVRSALRKGLFDPRRKATAKAVAAAQRMGLLRKDVDPLVAVDLLFGPLFHRRFVRQDPVTAAFVNQVFRSVLAGLRPAVNGPAVRRPPSPRRVRVPPAR